MKTKLLTLLTLLLTCVTGAWASTVSDLTTITSATTIVANTLNGKSDLVDATLYADGKILCVGGCGYSAKGDVTYNDTKYTPVYQIKNSRQLVLKIGFNATITVVGSTNSGRAWRIGTTSAGNEIASGTNGENNASGIIDGSSTTQTVYINASSDLYLAAIIITANSGPAITAPATASIKATESGTEVTEGIAVSGSNLTGSTLTATLSPAVTGLSVTLGSSAITAGAISTTATLHYTQTVNAKGSTTLRLSDGTTTKDITVNYTSKVVPAELVAINTATTFDLSQVGASGLDAITVDDGYVVLSDAGSEVSFADNLAVAGISGVAVTWRTDAVQAPLFKFKTSVPGSVTVKFSDVGSSSGRANRYANVNGTRTDVYSTTSSSASGGVKTSSPIAVSAGEVVIKGQVQGDGDSYTDNQIRVFTITFTPTPGPDAPTTSGDEIYLTTSDNMAGWRAFYPDGQGYTLDANTTAYIITAEKDGNQIALEKLAEPSGDIPGNTCVLLHTTSAADSHKMTLTKNNTVADYSGDTNKLQASTGALANVYRLGYGDDGVAFYPYSGTPATGTVYLNVSSVAARALNFIFDEGETTAISDVRSKMADVRGDFFDLSGRKVAKPTKGLYIVNGKKFVIK